MDSDTHIVLYIQRCVSVFADVFHTCALKTLVGTYSMSRQHFITLTIAALPTGKVLFGL